MTAPVLETNPCDGVSAPAFSESARAAFLRLKNRGPFTDDLIDIECSTEREKHLAAAERLLENEVSLLGGYEPQRLGEPMDWLRAPSGDLQWPTHLSRHYWLMPLGYAYRITGEERYAAKIIEVLLDWVERFPIGVESLDRGRPEWTNPAPDPRYYEMFWKGYCDGPWTSLSAHVRFDKWTELLQLIADSRALTEEAAGKLLKSLMEDHLQILLGFPRRMNQFQGVASSLIGYGFYYPGLDGTAEAERIGWERMEQWARREVYPDGSIAECSPNYGLACLRRLNEMLAKARRMGHPAPADLAKAVARGTRYYALTMDPAGRSPRLAKGGGEIEAILSEMNQVTADPDVTSILHASQRPADLASVPTGLVFPWAGHAVARSDWSPDASWLFFDMGPRGSGHRDVAQLGLQLNVGRQHLLADPGFYSYSGEGEDGRMSGFLKTTAAHNAAMVDGAGQIDVPAGAEYGPNDRPGEYRWSDDGRLFRAESRYTYGFGPGGRVAVVHVRSIAFDRQDQTLSVEDRFEGTGRHCCQMHWQLAPEAVARLEGGGVHVAADAVAFVMEPKASVPLSIEFVRGRREPLLGWFSKEYGHLTPTTTVVVTAEAMLPLTVRTTMAWTRQIQDGCTK